MTAEAAEATAAPAAPDVARSRAALANDAWEALMTAHTRHMRRFAAEEIWCDVSMREYDVLYTLSKCTAPLRLGDLNRYVLLSQPAMSRMVDRLIDRGLVSRQADPDDARSVRIGLTDAGRALQRTVGLAHGRSITATMTSALTTEELLTLERLALKLASQE